MLVIMEKEDQQPKFFGSASNCFKASRQYGFDETEASKAGIETVD